MLATYAHDRCARGSAHLHGPSRPAIPWVALSAPPGRVKGPLIGALIGVAPSFYRWGLFRQSACLGVRRGVVRGDSPGP